MKCSRSFFCFSFVLLSASLFAQSGYEYQPSQQDESKLADSKNKLDLWQKEQYKEISGKDYKEFHKERHEHLVNKIETGYYIYDDFFYVRLNKILQKIIASNPNYTNLDNTEILVERSVVPNAACYGNGIMVFNLGLISRLQNDDQLAFVISHELSHQILNHVDGSVKNKIDYLDSKEYKNKIKSIKNLEYNNNTVYESFLLDLSLKSSGRTRQKEREADSLAIVLLQNTNYKLNESLNLLAILDISDEPKYADTIDYKTQFSADSYEFQDAWLLKRNGLAVQQEYDQELIDSLKTHPDCDLRISLLEKNFKLPPLQKHEIESVFKEVTIHSDFELIHSDLLDGRYGRVIENGFVLQNYYPDNDFLTAAIGISLAEIYFAQKNHSLRQFVPLPDDDYNMNYHRILLMINNIRLSDLKKVTLAYYNKNEGIKSTSHDEQNEHLAYASYLYLKLKNSELLEKTKTDYLTLYPQGFFINKLKTNK
ncbi:MAG: M48 family metalloprotease [Flavobacteriales bacterium]|nr:M48 family metalloprotease [Flavobacteriales bacterium]